MILSNSSNLVVYTQHTEQMSDEEEDDDGCDIFADSEKEEEDIEDIEENTRPVRNYIVAISWQNIEVVPKTHSCYCHL